MAGLLSGSVDIPKVGKFPKAAVVLGVGGVVGLIIWEKRKHSAAPSSAPGAAAGDPYPPDGTVGDPSDPNSTDPGTGQTYGDEATSSGTGGGSGGVTGLGTAGDPYPWDGTYGNPSDPFSMDTGTGLTFGDEGGSGGSGGTGQPSGPPFSTNAQWSQYVLNYFTENSYADIGGRANAIGLYLAGKDVSAQQAGYIHEATAIGNNPPVSGPGNFPPSIRQVGSHGGTVTVPNVIGLDVEQATQILTAAGLHANGPKGVKGVVHQVVRQSPGAGSHVQKGVTVKLTTKNVTEAKAPVKKPPVRGGGIIGPGGSIGPG